MAQFDVYLEIGEGGRCLAHVPALPGCMVRWADEVGAMAALPGAIRVHIERLLLGDLIDRLPDGIEVEVVERHEGFGPFDPEDGGALFEVDREGLSDGDLGWYLRHAAENRKDLLSLVRYLPMEVLNWAGAEMMIGDILRHIGRSELWYLSRLVGETNPADEAEDVFDFLRVARETVVEGFRRLDEEQRTAVLQPDYDTARPEEEWTARKGLRRLLEHEREHIGHIESVLASWRQQFMVRLTAERAALIWSLTSFSEEMLSGSPVFENYSVKDLLAHVAAWDEFFTDRIEMALGGRAADIAGVDEDEHNLGLYEERQSWSFEQALKACMTARRRFEATIVPLADSEFHRTYKLDWGAESSVHSWSAWRYRHDGTHTADINSWREANKDVRTTGPKAVVLAAMETTRQEMLATISLIPKAERESRLVCGVWTLKDVLGHVADWEWYGVERWRPERSNRSLQVEYPGTIQEWNDLHAAARKDDSWERVWVDFINARAALRQNVEDMDEAELGRTVAAPWNPNDTNYRWILTWIHHEREHAADLRRVLALPDFPERLTHA